MSLRTIVILAFLFAPFISHTQVTRPATSSSGVQRNTYAVIVGISKYASDGITQLEYAHRDAQVFADYLKSKAGGAVPDSNIRLLVNENATYASIYEALNWLLEVCHTDDLVYFYFSGHGDMENNTIYKLGFLLSYNTPRTNYINNAVRIEDLNNIANTLSITNHAKVVLITDACHSGKLAGSDFRGTYLVGEQLRTVQSSEVRITSCAPDQLSMEDQGWGGGRGVFSYYLINGLEGLADYGSDGTVTVNEIKNYLDTALSADALLASKAHKQNPIIKGSNNIRLAAVDNATLISLKHKASVATAPVDTALLKPLPVQPQTYFFNLLGHETLETTVDFDQLITLSKEEIPLALLKMVRKQLARLDTMKTEIDDERVAALERTLKDNKDAVARFNNKFAVMLSDVAQTVINLYLDGDVAELERRRYYNSESNGYDVYPKMLAVALKITKPEDYLHRILEIKLHYFTGVAARLKTPTVENPASLLDTAMIEQKKALGLEENAAYIQNELGILYDYKRQYAIAEKFYLRATQLAPTWVIPWSNLIGLYANMNNQKKAIEASEKAKALKPDFQGIYSNTGIVYAKNGNLLLAEESYRKSIKINSRHYLPFEGLGYVYTSTTQYALADSFFYEAEKRKKGFHFIRNPLLRKTPPPVVDVMPATFCNFDSSDVGKNDVMGHFTWAMIAYEAYNIPVAEREFKRVIVLDKSNPLAFHYLGKLLYYEKRWEEGDIIFNLALRYYLDDSMFSHYVDSLTLLLPDTKSKNCILGKFRYSHYAKIDDHYFLASLYQFWNHFEESERHYKTIIRESPEFIGGYYKLWKMLESIGRYKDAEDVLRSYRFYDKEVGDRELYAFYGRQMSAFPDIADWYYKAGLFLYHFAQESDEDFEYDRKTIDPDQKEERYLQVDISRQLQITSAARKKFFLPGIGETIIVADKIYHPWTEGIDCLVKADSLLTTDEALADVNFRIGDMYTWQGLPERAVNYYKKSVKLKPEDANTRIKLIERCSTVYYLKDALEQLDSLNQRNEINFSMQLLLAKYCIHSGRFSDALKLLKDAKQIHPYRIPEIADLNGRLQLLSNHPKEALPFYKDYLQNDTSGVITTYTIARLFAQLKNTNEAFKWLNTSVSKGFNYYWVLKYDSTWDDYRKLQSWKDITGKIPEPVVVQN